LKCYDFYQERSTDWEGRLLLTEANERGRRIVDSLQAVPYKAVASAGDERWEKEKIEDLPKTICVMPDAVQER